MSLGIFLSQAFLGGARASSTLDHGQDFPDPFVLVARGRYYAYSTNSGSFNVPVISSPDLSSWTSATDALPVLPPWASAGHTWAPGVLPRATTYVLYYTVRQTSSGRQCISVATGLSPSGPFIDGSSGPLVCQLNLGGSIDPYPFVDSTGAVYLLWKSDNNALGNPTSLWVRQLSPSGMQFTRGSKAVKMLSENAAWQAPAIEGPAMTASGGRYYLFYGANNWDSSTSAIGYATCSGPLGPCVDQSTAAPWMATDPAGTPPIGPQGPSVFTDLTGKTQLAFAAWGGTVGYPSGGRALWSVGLSFSNGQPIAG